MTLPIRLSGLGYYLPETVVTTAALAERFGVDAGTVERATGVAERRYATGETQLDMGVAAAHQALAKAGCTAADIDLIISASAAPQQAIPCTAALLQRELGAPPGGSLAFDINATCLSFMVALQNVSHLLIGGAYRRALIVSADRASVSLNPGEWESSALFGDAAAAAVVELAPQNSASGVHHARFATWSNGAGLIQIRGGGTLNHPNATHTTPDMNWFAMEGPLAFRFTIRALKPFLDQFLQDAGWSFADVDAVIPHQANRHALEQVARLGFREDQIVANLRERGNCVSASVPLTLAEALASGRVSRGQRVLLLGSGAGVTLGGVALTL